MTLKELLIKVGFFVQDAGLKKADKSIASLKSSVLWLGTAITGMATAMGGLVYSTAEYATELNKTSKLLGINTTDLQELRGAAQLVETDQEALTMGMRFFGRITGEAMRGSKQGLKAFAEVGITSFRNVNGTAKTQVQLLEEVADRIVALRNPQLQLAAVFKLFSRGGTSMMPFLKEGSAGIKELIEYFRVFGYTLTENDIKASKAFRFELNLIKMFFSGLKNQIGAQLMPAFNEYLGMLLKFIKAHREIIAQNIGKFFHAVGVILKDVGIGIYLVYLALDKLVQKFGGWNTVLEVTGILLAGLVTYKVLSGFAGLISYVVDLASALTKAGIAAGLLEALPVLILALAGVLYLAYDDFKHFEDGQKSLIGELQKNHPIIAKIIEALGATFGALSNIFKIVGKDLKDLIDMFLWSVKVVNQWLSKIPFVGKYFKELGDAVPGTTEKVLDKYIGMAKAVGSPKQDLDQYRLSRTMGWGAMMNAPVGTAQQKQVTVNSNPTVNITVPAGTPDYQRDWFKDAMKENINTTLQEHFSSVFIDNPNILAGT